MVNRLDGLDIAVATSVGVLTASADVLFVKDISLEKAHEIGKDKLEEFVINIAKEKCGYKGGKNDLAGAVRALEKKYPIPGDLATNDFGGGKQHHLRDFSHHPTIVGLIFSLITQFTGFVCGTDVNGNFKALRLENYEVSDNIIEKIINGTAIWSFHLISDMAGSSSTAGSTGGTGIPGPLLSFFKEISSLPVIKSIAGKDDTGHNNFSVTCQKLFNGTLLGKHDENGKIIRDEILKFDLRTEVGIINEAVSNRQHIPVLINYGFVSAFYLIRRFFDGLKTIDSLDNLSAVKYQISENIRCLTHMNAMASAVFSAIDISAAGIKAAVKNKNNKSGFARDFLQGINYFGVAGLAVTGLGEAGIALNKAFSSFNSLAGRIKNEAINRIGEDNMKSLERSANLTMSITSMGTPMGFVSAVVGVYSEVSDAIKEYAIAREERLIIEKECAENIRILTENREIAEKTVSEYMINNLSVFSEALDDMEIAIANNDSNSFIASNAKIQKQLGKEQQFEDQNGFNGFMNSNDVLKF